MLSDGEAATIAVTVQALLTGAQLVTFISSLLLHIFPEDGSSIRKRIPWLIITILVMAFAIVDLAGTLQSRLLGLEGTGQLPASVIVITYAAKTSMAVALDGVLIYRCWVVYGKRWQIAILPLLLLLYNFLCIFVVIYLTAASGPEIKVIPFTEIYNNPQINGIEAAFVVATIVINVYATSAIIYRIFTDSMPGRNSRLKPTFIFAIRVVAESGLIYTIASIALVCAIFVSNAGTPFPLLLTAAIFTPIAGIAYNIIWIRVSAQRRAQRLSNLETDNLKTIVLEDSESDVTVEKQVHSSCDSV